MAALGAVGLLPGISPVRPARAAGLKAGFVYIGPREDWGWNESHKVAVIPAGTNYGPYADELQKTDYLIDGVIGSLP